MRLATVEQSDWTVSFDGRDALTLSLRWPKSSRVYFDGETASAKVVFLVPPSTAARTGGLDKFVANLPLVQD